MAEQNAVRLASDVVVVGAGVVGAATALLLANEGFQVAVVERRAPVPMVGRLGADPRTLAISPGSQRLLESVGAWPGQPVGAWNAGSIAALQVQAPQPYLHMCVWDGDGGGEIRFSVDDLTPMPAALGHIAEQSALTSSLWGALHAHPCVQVLAGSAVTALQQTSDNARPNRLLLADGRTVDAAIVIAADGAASPLRGFAGGSVRQQDTGQIAIATVVTHSQPHDATAWQVFRATGPLAMLPLGDAYAEGVDWSAPGAVPIHRSAVVWSCDAEYGDELLRCDDGTFITALGSAFGDRLGTFLRVDARARVALTQQQAVSYQPRPGVLLVGDAAHVIHPLAGQGVNLGLRDARLLTEVLGRIRAVPGALTNPHVLAAYELRARAVNSMALGFMAGIQRLFASDHPLLRLARSRGMSGLDGIAVLRRQLAREAMGQGLLASA